MDASSSSCFPSFSLFQSLSFFAAEVHTVACMFCKGLQIG